MTTVHRVFNFSAGPAVLPVPVLEQIQAEIVALPGVGMSILEISHRSKTFEGILAKADADIRALANVPSNYKVLFLQGGASLQFSMVPMNLLGAGQTADYIDCGSWAEKALKEARKVGTVNVAASTKGETYSRLPKQSELKLTPGAAYVHMTSNNTIEGTEYNTLPEVGDVPLVSDNSSDMFSGPIDVAKHGLIYAGAQKNIGPAGLTLVIVREDLLGRARPATPAFMDFAAMAQEGSMLNTPPTFAWYMAGLVFQWLKKNGGLQAMGERNRAKAEKLYAAIDGSSFYRNPVAKDARSWMNVPFTLANPELDKTFTAEAKQAGLVTLEGHRSVGGMRASLYNAMPLEGVNALVDFMRTFEKQHG